MQSIIKSVVKSGLAPKFSFSNQISTKSLAQIKNSIPLLQEKGNEITKTFYEEQVFPQNISVFSKDADTQARQGTTLAQFLVTLAKRAEDLEQMNTHFSRVSSKHVGFDIQPEQYPIFQNGIVAALKAHGAKPETCAAWGDLLSVVSKALQENETKAYQNNTHLQGAWNGARSFNVDKIEDLGAGFKSIYVKSTDGEAISSFEGGQYLTVKADLPGHGEQYRHVPICNTPDRYDFYRLTVPNNTDIGTYLQSKKVGETIELLAPSGNFTLKGHFNDVVCIGTVHSCLQLIQIANAAKGRNIYFIELTNNDNKDALNFFFNKYQSENPNWRTLKVNTDKEEFDYETITGFAPIKNADFYFCSPNPEFAHEINNVLTTCGVSDNNKFYEFEGPYEFLH